MWGGRGYGNLTATPAARPRPSAGGWPACRWPLAQNMGTGAAFPGAAQLSSGFVLWVDSEPTIDSGFHPLRDPVANHTQQKPLHRGRDEHWQAT